MRSRILAALLLVGLALGASSARADVTLGMYCTVASASTIDFPASGCAPGALVHVTGSTNIQYIAEDVAVGSQYSLLIDSQSVTYAFINRASVGSAGNIVPPYGGESVIAVSSPADGTVYTIVQAQYYGPTLGWNIWAPLSGRDLTCQWYSGSWTACTFNSMTISITSQQASWQGIVSPNNDFWVGLVSAAADYGGGKCHTPGSPQNTNNCIGVISDDDAHARLGDGYYPPSIASNACGTSMQGVFKTGTSPTDNAFTVEVGTTTSTGVSTCTITLAYAWVWNHATFTDNDSTVVPEIRADFHGNAAAVAVDHSGATVTSSTTGTCPSCTTTVTITATGSTKLDGAEIGITLF